MITESALTQFLGRLHPLVLHLPIGLWLGIGVLEFGGLLCRRPASRGTLAVLAWIAAAAAALAAGAGWLLAQEDGYGGRTLEAHRWLGVATAIIAVFAAAIAGLQRRSPFRVLLAFLLGTMLAAGHLGSQLTHGEDWLAAPFVPPPPAPTFATAVQPLFEARCSKCHGANKQKGDLALHTRMGIEHGGKNGAVLAAGKPDDSEMVRRILLPADDEDHMPPDGKPQVTPKELGLLRAWIAAGAPFEGEFAPTPPPRREPAHRDADRDPAPDHGTAAGDDTGNAGKTTPQAAPTTQPAVAPQQAPQQPAQQTGPQTPTEQPHGGTPAPATPGGRGGDGTDAPATDAAFAAGLQALRARLVHAAPIAEDEPGLWVDFAPIAATMTEAEARTLLTPVAARVAELGLARVPVDDDLLALCARMPMLRRLDLRQTRVTTRGLQALAGHATLQELVLAETHLDDQAADALLQLPALRKVHLWNAGLSAAALAKLSARADLHVDTGAAPAAAVLEVEAPPAGNPAATPGAAPAAAPAAAATTPNAPANADALRPVNDVCPVSGKPVDARYVVVHGGRAVGFCCPNCPKTFWAEPAKYPVAARTN